jgi:tRNA threonylcarbamoyladenosine biosynthesis protein TsaE
MRVITNSAKETLTLGRKIGRGLRGGETLGLVGNLGAGKTVFTQGLAQGLKIVGRLTSPTFVFMRIYKAQPKSKIKTLCHVDAYRIKKAQEILAVGLGEYFNNPDAVAIIEWADKTKKILPRGAKIISIKHSKQNPAKRIFYLPKSIIA